MGFFKKLFARFTSKRKDKRDEAVSVEEEISISIIRDIKYDEVGSTSSEKKINRVGKHNDTSLEESVPFSSLIVKNVDYTTGQRAPLEKRGSVTIDEKERYNASQHEAPKQTKNNKPRR